MQRRTLLQSLAASALVIGCGGKDTEVPADTDTGGADTGTDTDTGAVDTCEQSPRQGAGPFYLDEVEVRQDITEGKAGIPLRVVLAIQDKETCAPLVGAVVVIWQADATGTYSGFAVEGTEGETYLRGGQVSDDDGEVSFTSIYPGFYGNRTAHIHVSVRPEGRDEAITQIYFPADLNESIAEAYAAGEITNNGSDGGYDMVLETVPVEDGDGYSVHVTLVM